MWYLFDILNAYQAINLVLPLLLFFGGFWGFFEQVNAWCYFKNIHFLDKNAVLLGENLLRKRYSVLNFHKFFEETSRNTILRVTRTWWRLKLLPEVSTLSSSVDISLLEADIYWFFKLLCEITLAMWTRAMWL